MFVLDASGSIRKERFPIIKDFVGAVMNQFQVGPTDTQMAVLYYNDDAFVQFYLNTYDDVRDCVEVR